jgi:membrane fusion protein (multidrug efflux system)
MPRVAAGTFRLFAALALATALLDCTSDLSGRPSSPPKSKPAALPRTVRVIHPVSAEGRRSYPSSLYVERDVRVTARRSGIIEEVLSDRGSEVRTGQPLAVLERDTASAELEIARQELRLAESDLHRVQPLFEQKIASQSDFDRARIAREGAQSRVALAEAHLERCTVRAPFAGRVVERWAVVGLRVEEEDGTPLFRVVARDPLRARVDVPEGEMGSLRVGDRAWVEHLQAGAAATAARVTFIAPAVDSASGTVPVIVEVAAGSGDLKPGGAVGVRFDTAGESAGVLSLPREALLPRVQGDAGEEEVMIVAQGLAARRRIQVLESRGTSVLVRGSLAPSDRVILGAGASLAEGDAVEAREESR